MATVIHNAAIATVDDRDTVHYDAAILIEGDRIGAIGASDEILARHPGAERVNGAGKLVMPGFANVHTHLPMTLARGVFEDISPPHKPPFSGGLSPIPLPKLNAHEQQVFALLEKVSLRKGRMAKMVNHGTGRVRIEFRIPSRGLIGFRSEFLTDTKGNGIMHTLFEGYEPWAGDLRTRESGSLVADRAGATTGFALANLQERGTMFVGPGTDVYEGMIVGENSRSDDMDVNPTKEKKLTNMRSSTGDVLVPLIPHKQLSMEQALEFCREDECVEVAPNAVRIRKVILSATDRVKAGRKKG
mgnify:CR=1 FL=1